MEPTPQYVLSGIFRKHYCIEKWYSLILGHIDQLSLCVPPELKYGFQHVSFLKLKPEVLFYMFFFHPIKNKIAQTHTFAIWYEQFAVADLGFPRVPNFPKKPHEIERICPPPPDPPMIWLWNSHSCVNTAVNGLVWTNTLVVAGCSL